MARKHTNPGAHTSARASNLYQAVGGTAACRKLSAVFYAHVEQDPLLRPLFPGKTLKCAMEEFSAFLAQFLGGPNEDAQRRWWLSLRESHRFEIGSKERDAWMKNMLRALDDTQIDEPMRSALRGFFGLASVYVVNQPCMAPVSQELTDPPEDPIHQEIARRWDAQRGLDQAVTAVRRGDAQGAIVWAESPTLQACFKDDASIYAALLALMIAQGDRLILDYVRKKLLDAPDLATQRYSGARTLLHTACAACDIGTVELLLRVGVDPNVTDAGGHTPLYCRGNEGRGKAGVTVVRILVQAGANVDAQDGVKHCTALHMAARRGSEDVAEALLDCGANIEARDSLGDTPLRRSVNCDQASVARLLVSRGADVHSKGSRGITPWLAARTSTMKTALTIRS